MIDWLTKSRQKVRYQGKYNFHLSLNTEFVDSSSTISLTPFTDKSQRAAIPCNYIWFLIKNGLPQEVHEFKGSTFICDTSHIGYFIQAHVISNDMEYSGKAILTLGPVELDVAIKTDILNCLSVGSLSHPIYLLGGDQKEKECQLKLLENQIKIVHNYSDLHYVFDYSILEPMITANSKEVTKISILFNQKYETEVRRFQKKLFSQQDLTSSRSTSKINLNNKSHSNLSAEGPPKLQIRFLTRTARDIFLYSLKAFITKREMKNSAVIRKIQNINFQKEQDFSTILQLQYLRKDLIRYDKLYKQATSDKKKTQEQCQRMQRQMQTMISTYSKIIQDKYRNSRDMPSLNYSTYTRQEEPVTTKFIQLQRQNQQLNGRIKNLMDEIDQMRNQSVMSNRMFVSPTPFNKKRTNQTDSLANILQDLNRSEQICHFDADKDTLIDRLKIDKQILQGKLERSFVQIKELQGKMGKQQTGLQSYGSSSAIKITYGKTEPVAVDQNKVNQKLKNQIQEIRRLNDNLMTENKLLQAKANAKKDQPQNKLQSHLNKIRSQNRTTDILIENKAEQEKIQKIGKQLETTKELVSRKECQISDLKKQVTNLSKVRAQLQERCIKAQRKSNQFQMQLDILRRNQDVLNRSQNISLQMDNYNQQQIKILKEHNSFLVTQNQKLVKACEKYMGDAKMSNKLRQEILTLKEKLNKINSNPEANSFVV